MARMTEVKFGEFQIDQRYKKLERDLKLAFLRKEHNIDESVPCSLTHLSNINTNSINSSTNISDLHASKMGNDIVSSSKNLRSIFLKGKLPKQNYIQDDCLIMQPPTNHIVPRTSKKLNNASRYNSTVTNQHIDTDNSIQNDSNDLQNKKTVVFIKWKVMLTEEGQLAIKGILQCKKFFQTKPIVKRLTDTSVESVCKDLYHLQGNIVDDDEELPEYVRGKFYNGFPDDWKNVHQLWKTFVRQGCRASFRWPTAIADSDDDLKSEVTDVTYLYSENFKHEVSDLRSFKKSFQSEDSMNSSQTYNNKTFILHSYEKRDSFAQTSISIPENSLYNADIKNPLNLYNICNAECDKTLEDINLKYSDTKNKVTLKEKLSTLLNNLLDKNCPKKCISEIIKIIECLNNVVSVESNESAVEYLKQENYKHMENGETSFDSTKLDSVSMINDLACNTNMHSNPMLHHKCTIAENKIGNNEIGNNYEPLPRKRTFTEMDEDNSNDSFESENEIYAGTPRISAGQLFKKRAPLRKFYKRRSKKVAHEKYTTVSKQHVSDSSLSDNYIDELRSKQNDDIRLKDCSVNIARHGTHSLSTKQDDINPNIQSTCIKPVDFNMSKEEQWNRLNNVNKNKSTHEVQKCFVGENSTLTHRPINNVYNYFDEIKNRKSEYMFTENYNNTEKEQNFYIEPASKETKVESNSDKELINENYTSHESPKKFLYDSTSKIAKPRITSSIPVRVIINDSKPKLLLKSRKLKTNVGDNKRKSIKESNKENKSNNRRWKKSTTKSHSETDNATFLTDSNKNIEKDVEVQLGNVDSTTSRMSAQTNLEMFKHDQQNTRNRKPKKLTAWIPKVLCKPELSLIFEGSLLNDAGHVMSKKFRTDNVLRRVSPKVIETVHHEFYELIGDLNDTKHAIPTKLANHCRYGCPSRIDQFCKTWKILQEDDDTNSTQDITDIGDFNIGVSSKGRRIIRPLNYWTGERITFKDDNAIYSPGISQENGDQSKHEKSQRKNTSMEKSSDESKNFLENSINKTTNNMKQIEISESQKPVIKRTRRKNTPMQESNLTNNGENKQKHKVKKNKQQSLRASTENLCEPYVKYIEPKLIKNSRETNENTNLNSSEQMSMNHELSNGDDCIVATYYWKTSLNDEVLSDDLESRV